MVLQGRPITEGIAVGTAYRYEPYTPVIEEGVLAPEQREAALGLFDQTLARAESEINALIALCGSRGDTAQAEILGAHLEFARDPEMVEAVQSMIRDEGCPVTRAIDTVFQSYIEMFSAMEDDYFRERAADMKDVSLRLLRCAAGKPEADLSLLPPGTLLCAYDLLPADTVRLDKNSVIALLTEAGGENSHTAILARAMGLPTLIQVQGLMEHVTTGMPLAADADKGTVETELSEDGINAYRGKQAAYLAEKAAVRAAAGREARLKSGERVYVSANIGGTDTGEAPLLADGIGLFRSEFLYMDADTMPDEETQFLAYKTVLEQFAPRPVILRTLDIGGDKRLKYFQLPEEENPFLGCRGLRLCLKHPELFKPQLRAALRAAAYGELWLMFPMVGNLEEFRAAKDAVAECRAELGQEGVPCGEMKLGTMIEVPSLALIADRIAAEADFASIGTNDLTQYVTAADRMNADVNACYQSFHPGLIRLLDMTIKAFNAADKPICICGEYAGTPATAALLIGMGTRRLSMNASAIPRMKQFLAEHTAAECEALLEKALACGTAAEAEEICSGCRQ